MANKTTTINHQASSAFLYNNDGNLYFSIPANGMYSTGNRIYAKYATIASAIGLTAAKIVKGNTILGIAGTAVTGTIAPSTITVKSAAGSGDPAVTTSLTFTLKLGTNGKYTVTRNSNIVSVRDSGGEVHHGYALGNCTISQS